MWLISLINVPDDLYIQFSSVREEALLIGRRDPSLGNGKKSGKIGEAHEKNINKKEPAYYEKVD